MAFEIWDNHDSQIRRRCADCRADVWVGRHEEQLGRVYCVDCQRRNSADVGSARGRFEAAVRRSQSESIEMRERWARQDAPKKATA